MNFYSPKSALYRHHGVSISDSSKQEESSHLLPASLVYSKSVHKVFIALFVEYPLCFLLCHNLRLHMLKTCGIGKTVVSVSCARFKSHIRKSRPLPPPHSKTKKFLHLPLPEYCAHFLLVGRRSACAGVLFDMKVTQPVTSLCIITFQISFIDSKSTHNITLKYLGMYFKHSLHTRKCSFSYFSLLYGYNISNLIDTHYTV